MPEGVTGGSLIKTRVPRAVVWVPEITLHGATKGSSTVHYCCCLLRFPFTFLCLLVILLNGSVYFTFKWRSHVIYFSQKYIYIKKKKVAASSYFSFGDFCVITYQDTRRYPFSYFMCTPTLKLRTTSGLRQQQLQ